MRKVDFAKPVILMVTFLAIAGSAFAQPFAGRSNYDVKNLNNVFPALKDGDFRNQRATFRPEQQVQGSIGIPIMQDTAATTLPRSHSQTCDTFRAAARTARRTGRGTSTFADFDIPRSVPHGFVVEHGPKAGPRRIQDGFRHLGLRHRLGFHVADNDQLVGPHEFGGLLVQVVSSGVDDLGVDRLRPTFVASTLCAFPKARSYFL